MKKLKVLISAYACEPGQGSERGVGWNVAREIAKYHDVWVLTRPDESKEVIEAELSRNPVSSLRFVYFTLPFWQDSKRWGQSGAMQIHYYLWQIQAYFVARKLNQEIGFDLIHHVTFGSYWIPSFLSLLPIPFIWGPVGGGETTPKPFLADFSLTAKIYEALRELACWIGEKNLFLHLTARKSALVLAASPKTPQRLRLLGAKSIEIVYAQTGLTCEDLEQLQNRNSEAENITLSSIVRFVSVGRLLHWKGFHLGVRAFARAGLDNTEYWIIGIGPERERLENLVYELGLSGKVRLFGKLSRKDTLSALKSCQVMVHPSLHDFSPTACLEAMGAGLPVICLDRGGPSIQVTDDCGIKVPANNPEQTVLGLSEAMLRLAQNSNLRASMGNEGMKLAYERYSWESKGRLYAALYERVLREERLTENQADFNTERSRISS